MVRSGCVSKRRRAGSPTMMLPSGSRLTTEGQSVPPYGPVMQAGFFVCGSKYATRLLVVPKSIPTMRAICLSLGQFFRDVCNEIAQVRAAIQQLVHAGHELFLGFGGSIGFERRVPCPRDGLQLCGKFGEV